MKRNFLQKERLVKVWLVGEGGRSDGNETVVVLEEAV